MGVKGFIRAVQADIRRSERNARRRQRELERRQREYAKMHELAQAAYVVDCYENKIELLTSIHKECGNIWNWEALYNAFPPTKPTNNRDRESKASLELNTFEPGILSKMLGRAEAKKKALVSAVEQAKQSDNMEYLHALEVYKQKYANWDAWRRFAHRILSRDVAAYLEAIKGLNPFDEISHLGSSVTIGIDESTNVEVSFHPNSEAVIPSEVKSLLKSGKLSVKKMPKGQFNELYQDYVCGCVLRVARELYALLPINMVIIHALSTILNPTTGHLEEKPILSVAIPRKTLEVLDFEMLDPSDSMSNFVHNMIFKKTKGFEAVDKLNVAKFK